MSLDGINILACTESVSIDGSQRLPNISPKVKSSLPERSMKDGSRTVNGFPLFRKLPSEVRHMIWSYSVIPRIIRFPILQSSKPSLLQTWVESRRLALPKYDVQHFEG